MNKYSMVAAWSEEDSLYIASTPELPGCMADGKTLEEAAGALTITIREWLERAKDLRIKIPQPALRENE